MYHGDNDKHVIQRDRRMLHRSADVRESDVTKDYYVILGISADAAPDQIKTAYRQKAKSVHPDCSGGSSEPFHDVQQAYETLSDPARRKIYDDQLAQEQHNHHRACQPEPEPLIPTEPRARQYNVQDTFYSAPPAPLFRELFDYLWDEPDPWAFPRSSGDRDIHIAVDLTWEQARRGGDARIWLPVQTPCPACHGRGENWLFSCPHCRGSGVIEKAVPLSISYSAGVPDGATARLPLDQFGIHHTALVVHVRVRW